MVMVQKFLNTPKLFNISFLKTLYEVTASTNKDIIVKVGCQERCGSLSK